ncbi:uncharacterized protein BKA78DRAFT_190486 [Phyllosticta capitalensis]|uniref:uncharacterized protein n=1 Tax=Phyllosticta capitalensis TaxID=121624 RepID=UPI00312EFBA5
MPPHATGHTCPGNPTFATIKNVTLTAAANAEPVRLPLPLPHRPPPPPFSSLGCFAFSPSPSLPPLPAALPARLALPCLALPCPRAVHIHRIIIVIIIIILICRSFTVQCSTYLLAVRTPEDERRYFTLLARSLALPRQAPTRYCRRARLLAGWLAVLTVRSSSHPSPDRKSW